MSGPSAGAVVEALTGKPLPPPRNAALRVLRQAGTSVVLDRALVLWFPAGMSATGDDLAEFQLHGGRATVAAVVAEIAVRPGLEPAGPGDFTRRALENGRIDLSEAEGLADLLAAETETQRRSALALSEGGLRKLVGRWQNEVLDLVADIEAELDFVDEDDVRVDVAGVKSRAARLADELGQMLAVAPAERLRNGVSVVIAGPPNAGKSTLLNALAVREVAITSPVAGTTRDVVEASVHWSGVPFVLADTAGLRGAADDAVEQIGIERARNRIEGSDILLWLGDSSDCPHHPRTLHIAAKCDLVDVGAPGRMRVSAVTGEGLPALRHQLVANAEGLLPRAGEITLVQYQRAAIDSARDALRQVKDLDDLLLIADSGRTALRAFDRLTGAADGEALLGRLFARFCIGK